MNFDKNDWVGVTTPSQEILFWKAAPSQDIGIRQVSNLLQECQASLQFLECMDDSSHNHIQQDCKAGFDYLMDHFGDGGSIENMLYNVFQVKDTIGGYVYSAAVSAHSYFAS